MEDVRLARDTATDEVVVLVDATGKVLIAQERNRFAIAFSNQGPNDVTISMKPTATSGNGFLLKVGAGPMIFDLTHHGNIVTQGFFAICAAAQTATVAIWWSLLEKQ